MKTLILATILALTASQAWAYNIPSSPLEDKAGECRWFHMIKKCYR